MAARFVLLVALALSGCSRSGTKTVAEGQSVVARAGDHVVVGSVRVDVVSRGGKRLSVRLQEGARHDSRQVTGSRVVKFGLHRVELDENDGSVSITVTPYTPSRPLPPDEARFAADEAMSPFCQGTVACDSAIERADGTAYDVRCHDEARSDTSKVVSIDANTGAVLAVR